MYFTFKDFKGHFSSKAFAKLPSHDIFGIEQCEDRSAAPTRPRRFGWRPVASQDVGIQPSEPLSPGCFDRDPGSI